MSYLTYGVKVVCISNKNEETQEFLYHQIDPNIGIKDEDKNDEYWIESTADLFAQNIVLGEFIGDVDDIMNDWTFTVKYGVFRVKVQAGLAIA